MRILKHLFIGLIFFSLVGCKLGGTVEGLRGKLTLEETQTGEQLTIEHDGRFQFTSEFESGDTYFVVVSAQPSEPNQHCDVAKHEGVFGTTSINSLKVVCEDDYVVCPMNYDPVCAVVTTPIVCITTPCEPLENYQTFGNQCEANAAGAEVVLPHECGDLEGQAANSINMVPFATTRIGRGDMVAVEKVSIEADLLTVQASHSGGCGVHQFNLFGDTDFLADQDPAVDQIYFIHHSNGDLCDAYVTEDVVFNLTNLKNSYKSTYHVEYGSIELQITAPGAIPEGSKAPEKLYTVLYTFDDRAL